MLSIILLSYQSEKRIEKFFDALNKRMLEENIEFECIIMDDSSTDTSHIVALELETKYENVRAFQLSRNFTSHYSIFAGFSKVLGNCAVALPDDFQVPLDTVVEMYRIWEKGKKVVIPYRDDRDDPIISKTFSNMYYLLMNRLSEVNFPRGGADIFLADREIIDIFNKCIHPKNTSTIIEVLRLGFDPVYLPFKRPVGNNSKSRWTLRKKMRLALDTFFSSSSFPIKFISGLGISSFVLTILLIAYYVTARITGIIEIPGWTLLVITFTFFSGLILLSLGIIAEYVWRIFDEVKARPGYIIKEKNFLYETKQDE
jgi:glycosyltransferase involved in cell wall biosynthesis